MAELRTEHYDLLRAVAEMETPERSPGTKLVGERLRDIWRERGGPFSWHSYAPWNGTSPYAGELREAGLIEVHFGIARFRRPDQPAESPTQYWLSLTEAGHKVLVEARVRAEAAATELG